MARETRILIVDDDTAIRTLLFTVLQRRGLAVDTAKHGGEAIEKLGSCRYVLMLLDLMMPVVNGWQVLEHVKSMDRSARPTVLLLTAGTEPRDFDADIVAGTIRKPFDVEVLYSGVLGCIAVARAQDQLEGCPVAESHSNWHKT